MVKRLSNTDQNNNKLENVPTPVNPGDAANKQYVDDNAGGGADVPYVDNTAPSLPDDGMLWWDTDDNSGIGAGLGDVIGPASSTDNRIAVFDGVTGKLLRVGGYSEGAIITIAENMVTSDTYTMTNKRVTPRMVSTTSASSLTPTIATADIYAYTALASNLTVNAPTGSPANGEKLMFRIKDNGTSRTLTWNAIFRAIGVTLPTATTISKTTYVGCIYNSADTKWDVIAVATEA